MAYKVSIIIATYNTATYIEECLDSIFSQTLKEIEVIIIDDGSTDNTKEIVSKYQNKYNNLIYFYQVNKGAGIARNYGIDISRGEYLLFMDPDDKYPADDCVEKLYNAAKENKVDICGGNILSNDHGVIGNAYCAGDGDFNNSKNKIIEVKDYYYLYGHTRYLFNSELVKERDVKFDTCRTYEDQVFTIKAMGLAGNFYELDYPVYEYRINYKTVVYNLSLFTEYLQGFRDTVKLICDFGLRRMLDHNYKGVIEANINSLCEYAFCGNDELDSVIYDTDQILKSSGWIEDELLIVEWINRSKKYDAQERGCLENIFDSGKPLIIYGAGNNTRKLISQYCSRLQNIVGIAVSGCANNEEVLEGIKVRNIREYIPIANEAIVIITPGENFRDDIFENLEKLDFKDYRWIDVKKLV